STTTVATVTSGRKPPSASVGVVCWASAAAAALGVGRDIRILKDNWHPRRDRAREHLKWYTTAMRRPATAVSAARPSASAKIVHRHPCITPLPLSYSQPCRPYPAPPIPFRSGPR